MVQHLPYTITVVNGAITLLTPGNRGTPFQEDVPPTGRRTNFSAVITEGGGVGGGGAVLSPLFNPETGEV